LVRSIHKIYKKSDKRGQDFLPIFNTLINKLSKLEVKIEEQPAIKDPRKRQGLSSNYAQIFTTISYLKSFTDFEPIKRLYLNVKALTNNYSEYLNPRDMAELVASTCQL
jgi:hypothetical protein